MLADRGLGVVQGIGGPVERALVGDGTEAQELPQAHVGQRLREDRGRRWNRVRVISHHDLLIQSHPIAVINPAANMTVMELLIAFLLLAILGIFANTTGVDSRDLDPRNQPRSW